MRPEQFSETLGSDGRTADQENLDPAQNMWQHDNGRRLYQMVQKERNDGERNSSGYAERNWKRYRGENEVGLQYGRKYLPKQLEASYIPSVYDPRHSRIEAGHMPDSLNTDIRNNDSTFQENSVDNFERCSLFGVNNTTSANAGNISGFKDNNLAPDPDLSFLTPVTARYPGTCVDIPSKYPGTGADIPKRYPGTGADIPKRYPGTGADIPERYPGTGADIPKRYPGTSADIPKRYPGIGADIPKRYADPSANIAAIYPGTGKDIAAIYPGTGKDIAARYQDKDQGHFPRDACNPPRHQSSEARNPTETRNFENNITDSNIENIHQQSTDGNYQDNVTNVMNRSADPVRDRDYQNNPSHMQQDCHYGKRSRYEWDYPRIGRSSPGYFEDYGNIPLGQSDQARQRPPEEDVSIPRTLHSQRECYYENGHMGGEIVSLRDKDQSNYSKSNMSGQTLEKLCSKDRDIRNSGATHAENLQRQPLQRKYENVQPALFRNIEKEFESFPFARVSQVVRRGQSSEGDSVDEGSVSKENSTEQKYEKIESDGQPQPHYDSNVLGSIFPMDMRMKSQLGMLEGSAVSRSSLAENVISGLGKHKVKLDDLPHPSKLRSRKGADRIKEKSTRKAGIDIHQYIAQLKKKTTTWTQESGTINMSHRLEQTRQSFKQMKNRAVPGCRDTPDWLKPTAQLHHRIHYNSSITRMLQERNEGAINAQTMSSVADCRLISGDPCERRGPRSCVSGEDRHDTLCSSQSSVHTDVLHGISSGAWRIPGSLSSYVETSSSMISSFHPEDKDIHWQKQTSGFSPQPATEAPVYFDQASFWQMEKPKVQNGNNDISVDSPEEEPSYSMGLYEDLFDENQNNFMHSTPKQFVPARKNGDGEKSLSRNLNDRQLSSSSAFNGKKLSSSLALYDKRLPVSTILHSSAKEYLPIELEKENTYYDSTFLKLNNSGSEIEMKNSIPDLYCSSDNIYLRKRIRNSSDRGVKKIRKVQDDIFMIKLGKPDHTAEDKFENGSTKSESSPDSIKSEKYIKNERGENKRGRLNADLMCDVRQERPTDARYTEYPQITHTTIYSQSVQEKEMTGARKQKHSESRQTHGDKQHKNMHKDNAKYKTKKYAQYQHPGGSTEHKQRNVGELKSVVKQNNADNVSCSKHGLKPQSERKKQKCPLQSETEDTSGSGAESDLNDQCSVSIDQAPIEE